MILYLDTSALIKLYVAEPGSDDVVAATAGAQLVSTSLLTYVETRAGLARKRREGMVGPEQYVTLLQYFENDWRKYYVLEVSALVVRTAGRLAEEHGLRGFDAVHLASAEQLRHAGREPVRFLCADHRLAEAARAAGLEAGVVGL